jgi:hypothetical protein
LLAAPEFSERKAESFDFSGGGRNLEALSEEKGRTKSNLASGVNEVTP